MQKIVVDDFDILVSGEDLAFAFEMENMPVASAFLLYDGRNCAILIVNNLTSYILTNIVPGGTAAFANSKFNGYY